MRSAGRWAVRTRVAAAAVGLVSIVAVGAVLTYGNRPSRPTARPAAHGAAAEGGPAARWGAVAPPTGAAVAAAAEQTGGAVVDKAGGAVAPAPGPAAGGSGLAAVAVRHVERSASVTVKVKDVGQAFDAVQALAQSVGGYVESSHLTTGAAPGGAGASASLVLAVPQAQFSECLRRLAGLGTFSDTSVSGQDVTSQYVDLQARIDALQAERQSYLALLGKATAIGDVLQIQNALTDVQSQIESLSGQLRVLDDLSAMARVTATLLPPDPAEPAPRHPPVAVQRVLAALRASARAMAGGATALAEAIAWLVPWAAVGSGGWLLYRRLSARAKGGGGERMACAWRRW